MAQIKLKKMNRLTMPLLFILLYFLSCNSNKSNTESKILTDQIKKIEIPLSYDNVIQSDSIFESIEIIPLETKEECLITNAQKILVVENKRIFIQDFNKCLMIFDINGKFISKVGRNGHGPDEYLQFAGFDLDSIGNIYILDYHKILKYNSNGIFQSSQLIKLSSKEFQCWPEQFIVDKNGYYIWSGSNGIKDNSDNRYFAMYRISQNCKITEAFFPVRHKIMNSFYRFKKYNNIYNIDPAFGNDTIFSITKKGVIARYYLDFGKKSLMKKKIPKEFDSFSEIKANLALNYSFDPYRFTETEEWVYFSFSHNFKYYNSFYSKVLDKTFISIIPPGNSTSNRSFVEWIDSSWGNDLITLVDPVNIMAKLSEISSNQLNRKISSNDASLYIKLNKIKLTDNPVLFVCKMKKYIK